MLNTAPTSAALFAAALTLSASTPSVAQPLALGDSSFEVYDAFPTEVVGTNEYVSTHLVTSSDQAFGFAGQTEDWAFTADVDPRRFSIMASSVSAFPPLTGEGDDLGSRFFQFSSRFSVSEFTEATFSVSGAPAGAVVNVLLIDFVTSRYVLQMTDSVGEADTRRFWLDPEGDYGFVANASFDRTAVPGSSVTLGMQTVPAPPAVGLVACGLLAAGRRRRVSR